MRVKRLKILVVVPLLAWCPMLLSNQELPLEWVRVVEVASKSPRPLAEVTGQVSVIDAEEIKRFLLEGLDDLLRYQPGLHPETAGTRFRTGGVNIRGIGGNRVAIEVDGVPVRKGFAIGNYSSGGRALVETDRIKRLEVLHGPASTLYGSDALGGVMAFTTWDPSDLLGTRDHRRYFSLRGGYRGADNSRIGTVTTAFGNGRTGLLVSGTWRDGHQLKNMAAPDALPDPQDWTSKDLFLRLVHDAGDGRILRLGVEEYTRDARTRVNSILGYARFRNTTSLEGYDEDQTHRVSIAYEFSGSRWDRGVVRIFHSGAETEQLTLEERAAARTPVQLERLFRYESLLNGLELNLFRSFSMAGAEHHLGLGVEFLRTDSSEIRDGQQTAMESGSKSKTVLGEVLPVRDFPVSVTDELALFVQDEIRMGSGRWALIPALRYDQHRLEPRPDSIYLDDNPETTAVEVREREFSPRFGVLRQFGDGWSAYGQYARGFRAPPFEDANIGLDIPLFNIRAIPNPELRSETSDGFEFGLRSTVAGRHLSVAAFHSDYDDFIESRVLVGTDPDTGVLLFQSRNIGKARIFGLDLRLEQDLGAWRSVLDGWGLRAALYWSRGENRDTGQPLNSVSPAQAVVGLSRGSVDGRWSAQAIGTFTARQDRIDHTGGVRFEPPGYATFDITAGFRPNDWLELTLGVYNAGDKRYWRWSDVANLAANDPMLELLTRPGRNYSVSARVTW
jgi:hemoglobin/transferrin/lactoferrin receptor protein